MTIAGDQRLQRPRTREPRPGDLLVAAPSMLDPTFRRTVVYILQHNEEGSAGVILNRVSERSVPAGILPDWITSSSVAGFGGPVSGNAVLALSDPATAPASVQQAAGPGVCVIDLDGIDGGPEFYPIRLFVGHSGWGAGQLAAELSSADWFVVPGHPDDVLLTNPFEVWDRVLRRQRGVLRLWATLPEVVGAN